MAKARTLVGLDVRATKTVAAILDAQTGELCFEQLGAEQASAVERLSRLAAPVTRWTLLVPTALDQALVDEPAQTRREDAARCSEALWRPSKR